MADDELPIWYVPPAPPVDPNIGRRRGRLFSFCGLPLGKGGMGAAYLAEHEALPHIKCVIKLVLVEMTHHPMIISRYQTRSQGAVAVRHDGIVKLHGTWCSGRRAVVPEIRVRRGPGRSIATSPPTVGGCRSVRQLTLFFQLCWALQHAHGPRCDPPGPEAREPDGGASIPRGRTSRSASRFWDFGIAKVVFQRGGTATGPDPACRWGTPTYMAPEQVRHAAEATGPLGCIQCWAGSLQNADGVGCPGALPSSDILIYHKQRTEAPAQPPEDLMPRELWEFCSSNVVPCCRRSPDGARVPRLAVRSAGLRQRVASESGTETLRQSRSGLGEVLCPPDFPDLAASRRADPALPVVARRLCANSCAVGPMSATRDNVWTNKLPQSRRHEVFRRLAGASVRLLVVDQDVTLGEVPQGMSHPSAFCREPAPTLKYIRAPRSPLRR